MLTVDRGVFRIVNAVYRELVYQSFTGARSSGFAQYIDYRRVLAFNNVQKAFFSIFIAFMYVVIFLVAKYSSPTLLTPVQAAVVSSSTVLLSIDYTLTLLVIGVVQVSLSIRDGYVQQFLLQLLPRHDAELVLISAYLRLIDVPLLINVASSMIVSSMLGPRYLYIDAAALAYGVSLSLILINMLGRVKGFGVTIGVVAVVLIFIVGSLSPLILFEYGLSILHEANILSLIPIMNLVIEASRPSALGLASMLIYLVFFTLLALVLTRSGGMLSTFNEVINYGWPFKLPNRLSLLSIETSIMGLLRAIRALLLSMIPISYGLISAILTALSHAGSLMLNYGFISLYLDFKYILILILCASSLMAVYSTYLLDFQGILFLKSMPVSWFSFYPGKLALSLMVFTLSIAPLLPSRFNTLALVLAFGAVVDGSLMLHSFYWLMVSRIIKGVFTPLIALLLVSAALILATLPYLTYLTLMILGLRSTVTPLIAFILVTAVALFANHRISIMSKT